MIFLSMLKNATARELTTRDIQDSILLLSTPALTLGLSKNWHKRLNGFEVSEKSRSFRPFYKQSMDAENIERKNANLITLANLRNVAKI